MPKYVPMPDDLYETTPCFMCGEDVLDGDTDTCSDLCREQKRSYDEDMEWFMMREVE